MHGVVPPECFALGDVTGIDERDGLADVEFVLSGYQGGNDIGDAILDSVALVKERNPKAIYACDPVLGNAASGCFANASAKYQPTAICV